MKRIFTGIVIVFLGFSLSAPAQDAEKPEMKTYTFVMLKRGPKVDQDSVTTAQIQKEHMSYINVLAESGDLNVAGPFLDDGNWRGIFIFNTGDIEKVKKLVDQDPAVKAGRLIYEAHPWMTQKGTSFK